MLGPYTYFYSVISYSKKNQTQTKPSYGLTTKCIFRYFTFLYCHQDCIYFIILTLYNPFFLSYTSYSIITALWYQLSGILDFDWSVVAFLV